MTPFYRIVYDLCSFHLWEPVHIQSPVCPPGLANESNRGVSAFFGTGSAGLNMWFTDWKTSLSFTR